MRVHGSPTCAAMYGEGSFGVSARGLVIWDAEAAEPVRCGVGFFGLCGGLGVILILGFNAWLAMVDFDRVVEEFPAVGDLVAVGTPTFFVGCVGFPPKHL